MYLPRIDSSVILYNRILGSSLLLICMRRIDEVTESHLYIVIQWNDIHIKYTYRHGCLQHIVVNAFIFKGMEIRPLIFLLYIIWMFTNITLYIWIWMCKSLLCYFEVILYICEYVCSFDCVRKKSCWQVRVISMKAFLWFVLVQMKRHTEVRFACLDGAKAGSFIDWFVVCHSDDYVCGK